MSSTDENIMLDVKSGDVDQLGVLFDRYNASLFDFFCRMNSSRFASEDMVQEVFLRILKYRTSFQENLRFRTWMYQIARNVRHQHFRDNPAISSGPDNRTTPPCEDFERGQEIELVLKAMAKLSEETRELLVLVWLQEWPYDEVAELLGIETGTVKVRVHRAIKKLRELFQEVCNEKTSCNVTTLKNIFPTR